MNACRTSPLRVALACGGTGGHLFPGLAVARCLVRRGCEVALMISPKDVDQRAVKGISGMEVVTLPAVGLTPGHRLEFILAFWQSYRVARKRFARFPANGVLAMGGFTAAAPLLAGKRCGAATFLHESNTVPGRATRWLARLVNTAFVGFPSAGERLRARQVTVTGTPVRAEFQPRQPEACRRALGLEPNQPVVLVMGGSQGAHGLNELIIRSLPLLARVGPNWQWLHLSGAGDVELLRKEYAAAKVRAVVHPFLTEIDLAMSAATAAVSRAGASSLAELAAVRLPALLVPYPAATDNHQSYNARAYVETGAARMIEQRVATPEELTDMIKALVQDPLTREQMQNALAKRHAPDAAERIATSMVDAMKVVAGPSAAASATAEPGLGPIEPRSATICQ